jgi:Xaa-Pro aminopeptidase
MPLRDEERIGRVQDALRAAKIDALVCALPTDVLLVSGYYPIIGSSLVIFTREGAVALIAPEDEKELAARSFADEVQTFAPGSLEKITDAFEAVRAPLTETMKRMGLARVCAVGYEDAAMFQPNTYASMHIYGASLSRLLKECLPSIKLVSAGEMLARLRATLTAREIERVRLACRIAERAFTEGARNLRAGMRETEAAAHFRRLLSAPDITEDFTRADCFAFCMAGANAAEAYAAFQLSRADAIPPNSLALVHCNSYVDGFWTDITRTFTLGAVDEKKRRMYEAVLEARAAALSAIRPHVRAAEVDRAAREVMRARGFGREFKHGLGHGVGFAAINHNAMPRVHPASDDILETGMIFNIEPAIYIENYGGMRHCDMVVVTESGAELLTPFQARIDELNIQQAN